MTLHNLPQKPAERLTAPHPGNWAPFDRRSLYNTRHYFLMLLSGLCMALSVGTTVVVARNAEALLLGAASWRGVLIGIAFAALFAAGQWYFSDGPMLPYLVFLAPDVAITFAVLYTPASILTLAMVGHALWASLLASGAILTLSLVSAWLPEYTLFGSRR